MLRRFGLALLCSCVLLLPACTNTPATQSSATSAPATVPTPASKEKGVVTGVLLSTSSGEKKPIANAPLYLGNVLKANTGMEAMVSIDRNVSPKADVDSQGNFVFTDVPAGRYGLMLDTPRGTILLNNPDPSAKTKNMIIEVKGGDTVNLGNLEYDIDVTFSK